MHGKDRRGKSRACCDGSNYVFGPRTKHPSFSNVAWTDTETCFSIRTCWSFSLHVTWRNEEEICPKYQQSFVLGCCFCWLSLEHVAKTWMFISPNMVIIHFYLVGGLEPWNFMISIQLGMSSWQNDELTNSIISQRGRLNPTRSWYLERISHGVS